MSMSSTLSRAFSWSYFVAIYAFIFLPVAVLVLFSFQDGTLPIPPFNGVTLKWYAEVFTDPKLMSALGNSLNVAFLSSLLACLLGFCAAYGLARFRLPATALQRILLTAPLTVSYLIIALGLLVLFNWAGVRLSLWTVGIGHVVINLPRDIDLHFEARDSGGAFYRNVGVRRGLPRQHVEIGQREALGDIG